MNQTRIQKAWDIVNPFFSLLLCLMAATMIVTMVFGVYTGYMALGIELMMEIFPWLSLVITLVTCIMVLVILRKTILLDRVRLGFDSWAWSPLQFAAAGLAGAAGGYLWSTLIYLSGIAKLFPYYTDTASKAFEGQPLILVLVTTVIAAPVMEELIFRFMIYRRAKQYVSRIPAFLISAVLFGIYHANLVQFVYALGFSVLLTWLYEKSGNLLTPILAHGGANLLAVILAYFLPGLYFGS